LLGESDRPVSTSAKVSIFVGSLVVIGVVAVVVLVELDRYLARKHTRATLESLVPTSRGVAERLGGMDWRSRPDRPQVFLRDPPPGSFTACTIDYVPSNRRDDVVIDAWGRPLLFRYHGRAHPNGWVLYSLGPEGVDHEGGRDDLLIGEE
jgi:hypothetical protein